MKKAFGKILFILLCIVVFAVVAFAAGRASLLRTLAESRAGYTVEWNESVGMIYADNDVDLERQVGYDLYVPAENGDHSDTLILYLHGGGFTSGDKADSDAQMLCKYYTAKGYVCASVNYPLQKDGKSTNINLIMDDILTQVCSIQQEAARLGYPITQMAATGDSAGGGLALLYAYRGAETSPIPVKLVFAMTGPVTFDPEKWGLTTPEDQADFISRFSGITVTVDELGSEKVQQLLKAISPAMQVTADSVPTVVAYGTKDKIVPVNLKYDLLDALDANDVDYTYIEFPNSGHAMAFDPDKTQEYLDTVADYMEKYFGGTEQ